MVRFVISFFLRFLTCAPLLFSFSVFLWSLVYHCFSDFISFFLSFALYITHYFCRCVAFLFKIYYSSFALLFHSLFLLCLTLTFDRTLCHLHFYVIRSHFKGFLLSFVFCHGHFLYFALALFTLWWLIRLVCFYIDSSFCLRLFVIRLFCHSLIFVIRSFL